MIKKGIVYDLDKPLEATTEDCINVSISPIDEDLYIFKNGIFYCKARIKEVKE